MSGMTDRDHFAAAALTGLLAQGDDGSFSEESYARAAYRWADAMLRERERTNHDAAPAARASVDSVAPQPTTRGDSDRTDKAAPRPSAGTGDTPATHATPPQGSVPREGTEPVAWVVMDGHEFMEFCTDKEEAKCAAGFYGDCPIVPLYRSPTLTDAERDDIRVWLAECLRQASTATEGANDELAERWKERAKRAAAMIERTGGGR